MEGIDQRITLFINSFNAPWSDPFWVFMSQIKVWFPMYALVVALLIWKLGWKRGLVMVACIALAFFFNERVNNLIKDLVERVRPCNDAGMIAAGIHVLETGGGWSFPSGHACNSFGFAICSAMCLNWGVRTKLQRGGLCTPDGGLDYGEVSPCGGGVPAYCRWYTIFIVTWAILVAISRIMVARHYLGDVLVGAAIGSSMAILWAWIARKICCKFSL